MNSNPIGGALQLVGIVAIILTVIYWRELKWAIEHRETLGQVSDAAKAWDQLTGAVK